MRALKMTLAALAFAVPASAGVITFDTAPLGTGFTGPVYENGYAYQLTGGTLTINNKGIPGQDLESQTGTLGGSLVIYKPDGTTFAFDSIDFAAFESGAAQDQYLSLVGVAKDGTLHQEFYTLSTTNVSSPTYDNWTLETPTAGGLAGLELKSLAIVLFAIQSDIPCYGAVDNVKLTDITHNPGVPEPATLFLVGAGLLGAALRRRKSQKA